MPTFKLVTAALSRAVRSLLRLSKGRRALIGVTVLAQLILGLSLGLTTLADWCSIASIPIGLTGLFYALQQIEDASEAAEKLRIASQQQLNAYQRAREAVEREWALEVLTGIQEILRSLRETITEGPWDRIPRICDRVSSRLRDVRLKASGLSEDEDRSIAKMRERVVHLQRNVEADSMALETTATRIEHLDELRQFENDLDEILESLKSRSAS